MSQDLAHVIRGGLVESIHQGDLAVVDWQGNLLSAVGNPRDKVTFIRSSSKPIQALTVVEAGATEHFGLGEAEIAVMCASHGGEDRHVETVRGILAKIGLSEAALQCGTHLPAHKPTGDAMLKKGIAPTEIHSNCSGKHSGMLTLCRYMGWDIADYTEPAHPVQQAMLSKMARFAEMPVGDIEIGVDGCGVPVFGLSVYHMARAFANLANPARMTAAEQDASAKVTRAMMKHPFQVAGSGRICTDLMTAAVGRLFAKSGAEGVYCVGVPDLGLGIAVKTADGNGARCNGPVIVEALRQLGVLSSEMLADLKNHANSAVYNHRKQAIGEVKTAFTLRRAD